MKLHRSTDGRLEAFAAALSGLAADAPRLLGEAVAEGGEKALAAEFAGEKDPAGNRWARRKQPTGSWAILAKTKNMRDTTTATPLPSAAEFTVETPGEFHQGGTKNKDGTRRMVARPVLPQFMTDLWRVAIAEAVRERIADRLRVRV